MLNRNVVRRASSLFVLGALSMAPRAHAEVPLPSVATPVAANPTDVPAIAVPPETVDAGLLTRLVAVLRSDSSARAEAVRRLGQLSDARVVAALRYIGLHDRHVRDAAAAVLAEAAQPEAVAALQDLARGTEGEPPLAAAASALARHPLPAAWQALRTLADDANVPTEIRQLAIDDLQRLHPEVLATRGVPVLAGPPLIPTIGGAFFGGYALAAVGEFAVTGSATTIGGVAGAIGGAGAGYLLGRHLTAARQGYYLSAMAWGTGLGWLTGNALVKRERVLLGDGYVSYSDASRVRARAGLSLAGEALGFGLAWWAADRLRMTGSDVLLANMAGVTALAGMGGALGLMNPTDDDRPGYAALASAGLIGLGLGVWAAPHLRFESGDQALMAAAALEGAYYGGFITALADPKRDEASGSLLGASLGAIAAGAVSQFTDTTVGNAGEWLMWGGFGKLLGGGVGLMLTRDERQVQMAHLGVGLAGSVAGGWLMRHTTYTGGDRVLIPVGTALGALHGGMLARQISNARPSTSNSVSAGIGLTTTAVFGLGSIALAQKTHLSTWQVTMGASGALWGAWLAGWASSLQGNPTSDVLTQLTLGADAGMAVTTLLLSPWVDLDPRVLGGANFGAVLAAGLGTLGTAMVTSNEKHLKTAVLTSTTVGLVGGGLLTHLWLRDKPRTLARGTDWPAWASLPVQSISAAPHFDTAGRMDGATLQVSLDVWR